MGSQQGIAGYVGSHLMVPQDEMRENREYGFARGTLDTPDGETTQADTGIMGVACQASAPATGGFMFQLKAEGHDEGENTFEKRLAIAKQLEVRRFTPEINGDGAVFAGLVGRVAHGHPSVIRSRKLRRHHGGNACKSQGATTKSDGMWFFRH
jgi:hypothetical protein